MTVSRRKFLAAAGGALAAPAVARPALAQAQVTLKLHHFLPPVSNPHQKLLMPWAEKVEAECGGKLKIEMFPSMQLGGTPPQLYDQAKDGVVDIVWTLPGITPGRFPSTEVFELPFVASRRSLRQRAGLRRVRRRPSRQRDQGREAAGLLGPRPRPHPRQQAGQDQEDMKGLSCACPTRLAGEALKALGATAIAMPIPQVPESLAQKVIDGCVVPWEVVPAIKVHELVKYHTEIPGSPTLYTTTFFLAMNKAKYEGLPADLKAIARQELRHDVRRAGRQHVGRCRRCRCSRWSRRAATPSPPSPRTRRPSGVRRPSP